MCFQKTYLYLCTCTETLLPIPCSSHISSILHSLTSTTDQTGTSTSTNTNTNTNPPFCNGHQGMTPLLLQIDEECQIHRQIRVEVWIAEDAARQGLDHDFALYLDHHLKLDLNSDLEMLQDRQALPVVDEPEVSRTGEDEREGIEGNTGEGDDEVLTHESNEWIESYPMFYSAEREVGESVEI